MEDWLDGDHFDLGPEPALDVWRNSPWSASPPIGYQMRSEFEAQWRRFYLFKGGSQRYPRSISDEAEALELFEGLSQLTFAGGEFGDMWLFNWFFGKILDDGENRIHCIGQPYKPEFGPDDIWRGTRNALPVVEVIYDMKSSLAIYCQKTRNLLSVYDGGIDVFAGDQLFLAFVEAEFSAQLDENSVGAV